MILPLLLLLGCPASELPPKPQLTVKCGCQIEPIQNRTDPYYGWWQVHVWTEDVYGGKWRQLHAVREKRSKAFDDCDRWLQCLYEAQKKEKR